MRLFDKSYGVIERAVYEDKTTTFVREQRLTRKQAVRSAADWQRASDHNRLLIEITIPSSKRKPLPVVTYTAQRITPEATA